jgi:hypothetical protein
LEIPARFHPGYSLLGRWLVRLTGDRRQAEAWYIIVVMAVGLGLLLAQYLGWALLKPTIQAAPAGPEAMAFWLGQIGGVLAFLLLGCVGVQPAVTVACSPYGLDVTQGRRHHFVAYGDITSLTTITPECFHRHYSRYAATRSFVNRLPDALLLIRTAERPVVLGLGTEDRAHLVAHLEGRHIVLTTDEPVHIA